MTKGDVVRKRRLEMNLTAEQLGEAIGKGRATIYRYESGETPEIPDKIAQKLADVLHLPTSVFRDWLLPVLESLDIEVIFTGNAVLVFDNEQKTQHSYSFAEWNNLNETHGLQQIFEDLKTNSPVLNDEAAAKRTIIDKLSALPLEQLQALEKIADTVLSLRGDKT